MKKRLSIIMTMIMLVVAFTMIPMQCVEAKGKVKLSTTKKTLQIGKTYTITLKNAKNVKWKSGNKAIVTVKKKGKNKVVIRAKAAGKTTVVGTYKGKKYKCKITVKKKPESQTNDDPKLNATEVDLYSKGDSYADLEPKDSKYINQFQFKVTGTSKEVKIWNLEGEDADYFKLNQNGMVTVDGCPGYKETMSAIVKVKLADGTILRADVRLHALRDVLIDQKFKEFKDTYITSNMTDEEKIAKVAWYAGAFSDYEAGQPGWMDLLLRGKGDCMASRLLVARMCVDLGMKAYGCSAEYHGETIVHAGDTYYLVTTGFKEPRPRSYVVAKIETDDIEAYCKGKGVPWVVVK